MVYGVVSYSHKNMPLQDIYKYDITRKDMSGLDALMLKTCNRIEVYFHSDSLFNLYNIFSRFDKASANDGIQGGEFLVGEDAIKHAFRVSAGLESIIVGEDAILGQVRSAFKDYVNEYGHGTLAQLFENAIMVGRKIRRETSKSNGDNILYNSTVEAFKRLYSEKDKVAMVGSGMVISGIVRRMDYAFPDINPVIFSRSDVNAARLANKFGLEHQELDIEKLNGYDIVISAIKGGNGVYLEGPKAIIDLSVPRAFLGKNPLYAEDIMNNSSIQSNGTTDYIDSAERIIDIEVRRFMSKGEDK